MNEGCSACACGISGACDKLYYPEFLWPGLVALALTILVLAFLSRKKLIKIQFRILFAGWLVLVLVFAGAVYLKTESEGDRTRQAEQRCQASDAPICEY